jgi:hypothetical protein
MSKSYSAENPTNLLRLNADIARNQPKLASKVIIYQPTFSNKLVSSPYNLIQVEQNTDETMDTQPLLEERKKLGLSTCKKGNEYDCALNTLLDMGLLQDNEAHYLWPAVNKSMGLHPEYVRQILYYYYHKRYKGAYLPDIYMLIADVNTPEQLDTVLESLKLSLKNDHYTYIGGAFKTSGGHAFLVGKDLYGNLIFKDQQKGTGWVSKKDPYQYQKMRILLSLCKNLVFFVERDVGLERLRARKPKPSPRKTSKTRKRKRGRTPSLRRRKSNSLPSLKKRKHEHDYGIFPNTPGGFHPGVRRKTNKKRKNAKKKTQKRKRK